jgi:hypothetical protein
VKAFLEAPPESSLYDGMRLAVIAATAAEPTEDEIALAWRRTRAEWTLEDDGLAFCHAFYRAMIGAAPSGPPQYSGKVLVAAAQNVSEASEQDDQNPVGD